MRPPNRLALIPVSAGIALLAWSATRPAGAAGAAPAVASTIAIIGGVPLALPFLARIAGRVLADSRWVVAMLAGRRLEADPVGSVRPLLGAASIVFTLLTTAGYVAAVTVADPPPRVDPELDAATVLAFGADASAIDRFAAALPDEVVAVYSDADPVMQVAAACTDLARLVDHPCKPDDQLTDATEARLSALIGRPAEGEHGIELVSTVPSVAGRAQFLLVLGRAGPTFTSRVEAEAPRFLLAPQVATLANLRPRPSPIWAWIRLGIVVTATLLTAAVVVSLGDRVTTASRRQRTVFLLGIDGRRLRRIEATQTVLLVAITVGMAWVAGLANAVVMARTAPGAQLPGWLLVATALTSVVLAGVCTLVSDGATRSALRRRDPP